jgi:hypothetical protein
MIRIGAEHIYLLRNSTGKPFVSTLYRSISSDAASGNKTTAGGLRYVNATDVFPFFTGSNAAVEGNIAYNIMGSYATATLTGFLIRTVNVMPTKSFALNDLIVTRNSARYTLPGNGAFPFQEIQQQVANHTSVGKNDVGALVLQTIQGIQRVH